MAWERTSSNCVVVARGSNMFPAWPPNLHTFTGGASRMGHSRNSARVDSSRCRSHPSESRSFRVLLFIKVALFFSLVPAVYSWGQSIPTNDPRYGSQSAAMNHLTLGLDLVRAGTPDDLYYA